MNTIRRAVRTVPWVLWTFATICLGANLPLPQYPVIFIHGLASDAETWKDLRTFLTSHGWANSGSRRFVKATNPTNDSVIGVSVGSVFTMNISDYNQLRRHSALSYFSPVAFETQFMSNQSPQTTSAPVRPFGVS